MPRKAPDKVIEHRISLSNFERDRINTLIRMHKYNSASRSVTNTMGAVSLPVLAVAALIWVGFSWDDAKDKAKSFIFGIADPISDWITKSGIYFNYTADEIGRAIQLNNERKLKLNEEYQEYISSYTGNPEDYDAYYYGGKASFMRQKLTAYENRDKVLRQMLRDISSGENTDLGWLYDPNNARSEEFLQTAYEGYSQDMGYNTDDQLPPVDWDIQNEPLED